MCQNEQKIALKKLILAGANFFANMQFTNIHGLDEVKKSLIQSANTGHVAHAQLFLGPEGSANLAMALAFATYLNCEQRHPDGSCASGPSADKMQKYIHPDLHFVFPVSATKNISGKDVVSDSYIKEWRSFITENPYGSLADWSTYFGGENKQLNISKEESRNIIRKLSLKAFEGRYKIVIIWMPEYLHPAAANGILKVLEEPPGNTVFLLVAHEVEKLLPTIVSRTQIVDIPAFRDEEVISILSAQEGMAGEEQQVKIRQVAMLVEGNLNHAFRLLNQVEEDSHQLFRNWMRLCYVRDYTRLVNMAEGFQKMGKEAQKSLLHYGLSMMRETLVMQTVNTLQESHVEDVMPVEKVLIRLQGDELSFVANFSKAMKFDAVEKTTGLLNEGYYHLERNANPKILFLDISLKIAHIIRN